MPYPFEMLPVHTGQEVDTSVAHVIFLNATVKVGA